MTTFAEGGALAPAPAEEGLHTPNLYFAPILNSEMDAVRCGARCARSLLHARHSNKFSLAACSPLALPLLAAALPVAAIRAAVTGTIRGRCGRAALAYRHGCLAGRFSVDLLKCARYAYKR